MKVRPSVKRMCDSCKIVKRRGVFKKSALTVACVTVMGYQFVVNTRRTTPGLVRGRPLPLPARRSNHYLEKEVS